MNAFKSGFAPLLESFVRYRMACNKWNDASYGVNLDLFDKYCFANFPEETVLRQEMVDRWCKQRTNESNNGCISRIYVIVSLIRYLRDRGLTIVQCPVIPVAERRLYVPHFFTHEELKLFFNACDNYKPFNFRTATHLRVKYTLPVLFRLLYSSGMRTTEVRELRRHDVDLDSGVVSIANTKGYEEHFVVLHDSMLDLMKEYDQIMETIYPDRKYFFPKGKDGCFTRTWVAHYFRVMWKQVSDECALPYELRHNYAIENINRIVDRGMSFEDSMVYLSKSMGHTSVEITARYYYHLVPSLSELLQQHTEVGFNALIPEVENEEI